MKSSLVIKLVLIMTLGFAYSLPGAIPSSERAALIALYTGTNGDSWTVKTGWKDGTLDPDGFQQSGTEGTWYGITVVSDHVTRIDLRNNGLSGSLPGTQWTDLASLTYLDVGNNAITSSIPTQLGSLTNLTSLYLYSNQLTGSIPTSLGSLTSLQTLMLQSNQLSGSIPVELGSLSSLDNLALSSNQLTGSIPGQLGSLTGLSTLYLSTNQLSGAIPSELGNLASVEYLHLQYNQLTNAIPSELGNLSSVRYMYLNNNQLSNAIPTSLGGLANVVILNLSNNDLTDPIPSQLGSLSSLTHLYLNGNQLTGSIPPQLENLSNLSSLNLADNQLSGSIPSQLGHLSSLETILLYGNMLSGEVPLTLLNLTSLADSSSDFRYNAIHTIHSSLRTFLNSKQTGGDFEATQTVAPAGLLATPVDPTTIDLSWTPITYTGDTGGYRIFRSTVSGGPYTYRDQTTSKSATGITETGLTPGQVYYYVIKTRTDPHTANQNTVDSEYSAEFSVSGITPAIDVVMPNGGEDLGAGASVAIQWTYAGSIGNVKIEYSTDSGSSYSTVVASQPAGMPYYWTVPNTPSANCLVRVSDASNSAVNDVSDAAFTISAGTGTSYYNSPSNRLIISEVNWAAASGGGTWVSEVEVTDISGGSTVEVYYNSGTTRNGPFTLWSNSGGAGCSTAFSNILNTVDGLDASGFVYYGTSGTLELVTQDSSHLIQAAVRTYNGNYSRTFPALADNATNAIITDSGLPQLIIPNISNNGSYRPSVVLFNPSDQSVDCEVKIIGSDGVQVGSTISRSLAGYEMNVITTEVRANTYSNAFVRISSTSGAGRIMASGQTANNSTNDPAAHLAVHGESGGYASSPGQRKYLTEVNWAAASGGGQWVSEVQIIDITGGSTVQVYYNSGTTRNGPFTLWTNSGGADRSVTFSNILSTIDGLDSSGFVYYGTSGALEFVTQDSSHLIQAAVRTFNGNYSRTFPALSDLEANTAASGRTLVIPNISNNASYRPSVVLFNPSADSVTCEVKIIGSDGSQVGSTINRTVAGFEMNVITTEVRANTYNNAFIQVEVISGSGRLLVSGQTANNTTNDPAAHVAVQGQ